MSTGRRWACSEVWRRLLVWPSLNLARGPHRLACPAPLLPPLSLCTHCSLLGHPSLLPCLARSWGGLCTWSPSPLLSPPTCPTGPWPQMGASPRGAGCPRTPSCLSLTQSERGGDPPQGFCRFRDSWGVTLGSKVAKLHHLFTPDKVWPWRGLPQGLAQDQPGSHPDQMSGSPFPCPPPAFCTPSASGSRCALLATPHFWV